MPETQETIEIFVVDGRLKITPVQVLKSEWENKKKNFFSAQTGTQPIIVFRGGWNKFTTYGGFKTSKEAEEFKELLKQHWPHLDC